MRHVVGNVHRLGLVVSNVFLVDGGAGGRWLLDCGHAFERARLVAELLRRGLLPGDLAGVLLTHRHSDHAGNAAWLQRRGVKVLAHRADAEVLAGRAPRQPLRSGGLSIEQAFCALEDALPARLEVDGALEDGDTVGSIEVRWVPGHTEGSVFYRDAAQGWLATGDSVLTSLPPLTVQAGLALAHPCFSVDLPAAHRAVRAFHDEGVPYEHLLPGHGAPIVGGARARVLEHLAGAAASRAGAGIT